MNPGFGTISWTLEQLRSSLHQAVTESASLQPVSRSGAGQVDIQNAPIFVDGIDVAFRLRLDPALFTRMSRRPRLQAPRRICARSRARHRRRPGRSYAPCRSTAVAGSFPRLTKRLLGRVVRAAEIDGDWRPPGKRTAMARPIPREAPVTRAYTLFETASSRDHVVLLRERWGCPGPAWSTTHSHCSSNR